MLNKLLIEYLNKYKENNTKEDIKLTPTYQFYEIYNKERIEYCIKVLSHKNIDLNFYEYICKKDKKQTNTQLNYLKHIFNNLIFFNGIHYYKVDYYDKYIGRLKMIGYNAAHFSLTKNIRKYISHDTYIDVDLVNAHPSLILTFCNEINLKVPNIERHVLHRNILFEKFDEVDKELIKIELFKIYYYPKRNISRNFKSETILFLEGIKKDCLNIYEYLFNNSAYISLINDKIWNTEGSTLNLLAVTLEKITIMSVLNFLEFIYPYKDLTCLIHDGFLLYKNISSHKYIDVYLRTNYYYEELNLLDYYKKIIIIMNIYLERNFGKYLFLEEKDFMCEYENIKINNFYLKKTITSIHGLELLKNNKLDLYKAYVKKSLTVWNNFNVILTSCVKQYLNIVNKYIYKE